MNNEELVRLLKHFSDDIVRLYFHQGQPPHDAVIVLLLVNPFDPDDASAWLGQSEDAREALERGLPGFKMAHDLFEDLLQRVPASNVPAGLLRVFAFSENGANVGYISTYPGKRAQA